MFRTVLFAFVVGAHEFSVFAMLDVLIVNRFPDVLNVFGVKRLSFVKDYLLALFEDIHW